MPLSDGFAAGLASVATVAITFPIDTYRVQKSLPGTTFKPKNILHGLPPTAANLMLCRYIAFTINAKSKELNKQLSTPLPPIALNILSSALTGCKVIITYPGDLIKINKQLSNEPLQSIFNRNIHYPMRHHQLVLGTMWGKSTLGYITWFQTQQAAQHFNQTHGFLGASATGAISSIACTIATTPFEIIKINLQAGKVKTITEFIKTNGLQKLMPIKPMAALFARSAISGALFNALYTKIKDIA